MGLTVHFKLAAPAGCDAAQAKQLVESMRRTAGRFHSEGLVDRVHPITSDVKTLRQLACDYLILPVVGQENTSTWVDVFPTAGFLFEVEAGGDCEPLQLGLCQYPAKVGFQGQELRTKKRRGLAAGGFQQNAIRQPAWLGTFSTLPLRRGGVAGCLPDAGTAGGHFGRGRLLAAPFTDQVARERRTDEWTGGGRCGRVERCGGNGPGRKPSAVAHLRAQRFRAAGSGRRPAHGSSVKEVARPAEKTLSQLGT